MKRIVVSKLLRLGFEKVNDFVYELSEEEVYIEVIYHRDEYIVRTEYFIRFDHITNRTVCTNAGEMFDHLKKAMNFDLH